MRLCETHGCTGQSSRKRVLQVLSCFWPVLTQRFSSCIHRALHVRDNKEAQAKRGVRPQSASATPKRSKTCEEVNSGVIGSNELKNGRTSVVTCKEMRKARVGWGEGMSSSSKVSDELLQLLHRRTLVYGDSGKDMQNTGNLEVNGCRHSKDPGKARQSLTGWAAADDHLHEASAGADSKTQECRSASQLRFTLTVSTLVDESSSEHASTRSLTSALFAAGNCRTCGACTHATHTGKTTEPWPQSIALSLHQDHKAHITVRPGRARCLQQCAPGARGRRFFPSRACFSLAHVLP